jgi:hypothetical protein
MAGRLEGNGKEHPVWIEQETVENLPHVLGRCVCLFAGPLSTRPIATERGKKREPPCAALFYRPDGMEPRSMAGPTGCGRHVGGALGRVGIVAGLRCRYRGLVFHQGELDVLDRRPRKIDWLHGAGSLAAGSIFGFENLSLPSIPTLLWAGFSDGATWTSSQGFPLRTSYWVIKPLGRDRALR